MNTIKPNVYDEKDFISNDAKPAESLDQVMSEAVAAISEVSGLTVDELTQPIAAELEKDRGGQVITTDIVFELFASLNPNSIWATRLLNIRDLFNLMGTGISELLENPHFEFIDCIYGVEYSEGLGREGPAVKSFFNALRAIQKAHKELHPVRTDKPA